MKTDPRIDDYISKKAEFARPILTHLRKLIHQACPGVEENIKWGMPAFDYKGPLCGMAAFKVHCSLGFWKAAIMKNADQLKANQEKGMGHLGKITSLQDLPPDKELLKYIKEAIKLNETGAKLPPKKTSPKVVEVPAFFTTALQKNKKAKEVFEAFSPSHKREYLQWITEAKTDATRDRRLQKTLDNLSEGKDLNWKYR